MTNVLPISLISLGILVALIGIVKTYYQGEGGDLLTGLFVVIISTLLLLFLVMM